MARWKKLAKDGLLRYAVNGQIRPHWTPNRKTIPAIPHILLAGTAAVATATVVYWKRAKEIFRPSPVFYYVKSLAEQKKIAAILSKMDKAIEETDKLISKYSHIKIGLMQDLFT